MTTTGFVVTEELINKYRPMIYKIIQKEVQGFDSADVGLSLEEMFHECIIKLCENCHKYDPSRGMSVTSFIHLLISSRMGNFRNKIKKYNYRTSHFTDLHGAWSTYGGAGEGSDDSTHSMAIPNEGKNHNEYLLNHIVDYAQVVEKMDDLTKTIYFESFINGKKMNELVAEFPHLKYNDIRVKINKIRKIHNTLVEGNVCLQ